MYYTIQIKNEEDTKMDVITLNDNDVQPQGIGCSIVCAGIGAGCSALLCAAGGDADKITFSWVGAGSGSFTGVTAIVGA